MVIYDKIYRQGKERYLLNDEPIECSNCRNYVSLVGLVEVNWFKKERRKESKLRILCKNCVHKKREYGDVIERFVVLLKKRLPEDAVPFIIRPPLVRNGSTISTFDLETIEKKGGVTKDNTKYSSRSHKIQSLNYEKYEQKVLANIQKKDERLTYEEGAAYLEELFEDSKETSKKKEEGVA